ncbi:MAG TPA: hypothetical protein VMV90_06540 [Rectinemataceae bacterium]|nr:hypothetical protein [Rectinemataceae bacterium]
MEKSDSLDCEPCEDAVPDGEARPAEEAVPAFVDRETTTSAACIHTHCRFNFTGGIIR